MGLSGPRTNAESKFPHFHNPRLGLLGPLVLLLLSAANQRWMIMSPSRAIATLSSHPEPEEAFPRRCFPFLTPNPSSVLTFCVRFSSTRTRRRGHASRTAPPAHGERILATSERGYPRLNARSCQKHDVVVAPTFGIWYGVIS